MAESSKDNRTDAADPLKSSAAISGSDSSQTEAEIACSTNQPPQSAGADENFPPPELAGEEDSGQMDVLIDAEEESAADNGRALESRAENSTESVQTTEESSSSSGQAAATEAADRQEGQDAQHADAECLAEALAVARTQLLSTLFTKDRPPNSAAKQVIEAYAAALAATQDGTGRSEIAQLASLVASANEGIFSQEQSDFQGACAAIARHVEVYDSLFSALEDFGKDVGAQLQQLNAETAAFQTAQEPLKAGLANYRKGVEIIDRMLSRVIERKKALVAEAPQPLTECLDLPELPDELPAVSGYLQNVMERFHRVRDANHHAIRDAQSHADKCHAQVLQSIKSLLAAIDGIDSGLDAEPGTRASLLQSVPSDDDLANLVQSWTGCYQRLSAIADAFFSRAGITAHTVEPGTPFDPETMEPQGTVENPALKDEDVAAVARRGFSLGNQMIRPMVVDVVRNS